MFGHRDRREDKSLAPRLLSLTTFGVPMGYAGMRMLSWMNNYGYQTSNLMGLKVRYPNNIKAAFRDAIKKTSSLFVNMSPKGGIFDPTFSKNMDYYIRSMGTQNIHEIDQLVSSITKHKKTLETLQSSLSSTMNNLKDIAEKKVSLIDKSVSMVTSELEKNSEDYKMKTGMRNVTSSLKSFLDRYSNENILERIYRRIVQKHHILSVDILRDETKLSTLPDDVLRTLKEEILRSINEANRNIPIIQGFKLDKYSTFSSFPRDTRGVIAKILNIYEPSKFVKIAEPIQTDFISGNIDVKSAMSKFPSSRVFDKENYADDFMDVLFKKIPKFHTKIKNALAESGIQKELHPLLNKEFKQIDLLKNITNPQFGNYLHDLTKLFSKYAKKKDLGGIVKVRAGMQNLTHSNKLLFEITTQGVDANYRGKFTIPIIIPKHLLYQSNELQSPIIPHPFQHTLKVQMNIIKESLQKWIGDSWSNQTKNNLQGSIEKILNGSIIGVPFKGNVIEDLSKGATFSSMWDYLKSRGTYFGKDGILKDAWNEMVKYRAGSSASGHLLHFLDVGTKPGSDPMTKKTTQMLDHLSIITTERKMVTGINGAKEIKLDVIGAIDIQMDKSKLEVKQDEFVAEMLKTWGNPKKRWGEKALRTYKTTKVTMGRKDFVEFLGRLTGTGKIIAKAAMYTDIPSIKYLIKSVLGKAGIDRSAKTGLLAQLFDENLQIDSQKLMNVHFTDLPPQYTRTNIPIEATTDRIKNLFEYWKNNGQGDIAAKFKKMFNRMAHQLYGSEVSLRTILELPMFHTDRYDSFMQAMYTMMITDGRWNSIKNIAHWEEELKKIPLELKGLFDQAAISPASMVKGKFLALDSQMIHPFYRFKAPAAPLYQQLNAVRAFSFMQGMKGKGVWFNTKGQLPLTITTLGTEQIWDGLSETYRGIATFMSPVVADGETWMSANMVQSINIEERGVAPIIVDKLDDRFTYNEGDVINTHLYKAGDGQRGTIRVGTLGDKKQDLTTRHPIKILKKIVDKTTGKTRIEYALMIGSGASSKLHWWYGARSTLSKVLGRTPMRIDSVMYYDMFGKTDANAVIQKMLGQLSYFALQNPKKIELIRHTIEKSLEDSFGRKLFNVDITPFQTLRFSIHPAGPNFAGMDSEDIGRIFKNIFKVYRDLDFMQDRPIYEISKAGIRGIRIANGGWSTEVKKAFTDILVNRYNKDNNPLFQVWAKAWLEGVTDSEGKQLPIREVIDKLSHYDEDTMNLIWNNKRVPHILDAAKFAPQGSPARIFTGMMSIDNSYMSSTMPLWGTDSGVIKVSQWYIQAFKNVPGAQGFYQRMLDMINEQSAPKMGQMAMQMRIGLGQYMADTGKPGIGVNIIKLMKTIETQKGNEALKDSLYRFLSARSVSPAQLRSNNFIATGEPEINIDDFTGRVFQEKDMEFLRYLRSLGEGYVRHGPARIAVIPGRYQTWNTTQVFDYDITPLSKTGYQSGGNFVVLSEQTLAIANLLKKVRAGGPGYQENVQKIWDIILSSGPIKQMREGFAPGMQAMLQFGKPYVHDLAGSEFFKYKKDTVLEFEGYTNLGWIKEHALEFKKAMDSMDYDDMKFVAKYMRNYSNIVEGSPIKKHPSFDGFLKNKTIKVQGIGKVGINELLDEMQGFKNNFSKEQVRKLYSEAVKKSLLPVPTMVARFPRYMTTTAAPVMMYFRKMDTQPGAAQTIAKLSSLIMKHIGADADFDQAEILLAPPEMRSMMKHFFAWTPEDVKGRGLDKGLWYMAQSLLETGTLPKKFQGKGPLEIFFNYKKRKFEVMQGENAAEFIEKDVETALSKFFGAAGAEEAAKRSMWIKQAPPTATKLIYSYASAMDTITKDANWSLKTKRDIFDAIGIIGEWGTKQKKLTEPHNIHQLYPSLENLSRPGVLKNLESAIARGELPSLSRLLDKAPDEIWKTLGPWQHNDIANQQSFLAGIGAIARKYPRIGMYGNTDYRIMLGSSATLRDMLKANMAGHIVPDIPMEFQVPSTIPFDTYEESVGKSFKRLMTNVFGEKTAKNVMTGSIVAGIGVGAYLAYNFFKPDQASYLGHMPGRGGEYWDWTFTKPEKDWDYLMNTPFNNIFDRDKVYLRMNDARVVNNLLDKERKRKRLLMPKKDEIKPVIYNRSTFEF